MSGSLQENSDLIRKWHWIPDAVLILCLLMGAVAIAIKTSRLPASWATMLGKVLGVTTERNKTERNDRTWVSDYEYTVDGVTYRGHEPGPARRLGETVTVLYDPANPSHSQPRYFSPLVCYAWQLPALLGI